MPWAVRLWFAALMLPMTTTVGSFTVSVMMVVSLVTTGPLLLQTLRGRCGPLVPPDLLLPLFVGLMFASLLVNSPHLAVTQTVWTGGVMWASYLFGRVMIRSEARFRRLCRWVIWLVVLTVPFAVVEALTGTPPILALLDKVPGIRSVAIGDVDERLGLDRVQLIFNHSIHYGLFCAVGISLGFVALRGTLPHVRRWSATALVAAAGMLSLSSGGILAIALQGALIGWAWVLRTVTWRWRLLIALLVVAYVAVDLLSNRTPIDVFMSYATFSPVTAYWRKLIFVHGLENVWANPLFGLGFNDWVRPGWMHTSSVDNFWLLSAMRHGIPAFLALAVAWGWTIVAAMRRPLPEGSGVARLRLGYVFAMLALTLALVTVHAWGPILAFVMFLLGAGVWFHDAEDRTDEAAAAAPAGPTRLPGTRRAVPGAATAPPAPSAAPPRRAPAPVSAPVSGPVSASPPGRSNAPHSRFAHRHRRLA